MKLLKKLFVAGAFALASTTAFAGNPFTVDTSPAGGAAVFEADRIDGTYTESIIFDASGNWDAVIILNASAYIEDGGIISPFTTGLGSGGTHQLYITLDVSGSTTASAAPGELFLNVLTGTVKFWLDVDADTDFISLSDLQTSGGVNTIGGDTVDDLELASSSSMTGLGILNPSSSSFRIDVDTFLLSATGELFFTAPRPFYVELNSTGDLTSNVITPGNPGVYQYDGRTASVQFVSEPSSLAILGLGLLGAGFLSRRKS